MRPREQHRKVTYFSVFMFTITILEKVTHDVIFSLSSNKSRARGNRKTHVFDSFFSETRKYFLPIYRKYKIKSQKLRAIHQPQVVLHEKTPTILF